MAHPSPRSDESLYNAVCQNDDDALESLLKHNWNSAYHLALTFVRDPASAEDVAQEACLGVLKAARRGEAVENFAAWFRGVVANEARMFLRSRKRRKAREQRAARPEASVIEGKRSAIREFTASLPTKLRQPLELHFGLGLTHAEVAQTLGCPTGTASTWIREGLSRLRQSLNARSSSLSVLAIGEVLAADLADAFSTAPPRPSLSQVKSLARLSANPATAAGTTITAWYGALAFVAIAAAISLTLFFNPRLDEAKTRAIARRARPTSNTVKTQVAPRFPNPNEVRRQADLGSSSDSAKSPSETSPRPFGTTKNTGDEVRQQPFSTPSTQATGPEALTDNARRLLNAKGLRHRPQPKKLLPGFSSRFMISIGGGEVRLWDLQKRSYRSLTTNTGQKRDHFHDALVLDKKTIATIDDHALRLWDLRTGAPLPGALIAFKNKSPYVPRLAARPDSRQVLLIRQREAPQLFDFSDNTVRKIGPGFSTKNATFSPDGSRVITFEFQYRPAEPGRSPSGQPVPQDCKLYPLVVWDLNTEEVLQLMATVYRVDGVFDDTHVVQAFVFDRGGSRLTTAGGAKIRRWDWEAGREILPAKILQGRGSDRPNCQALIAAPGIGAFVVGSDDGVIRVLDELNLDERQRFSAHSGSINTLLLMQDGRTLASGGNDGKIRF